jgi:hypothetical protein
MVLHRSRLIHLEDRGLVDGIPVMSVARTIVDLAEGPERPAELARELRGIRARRMATVPRAPGAVRGSERERLAKGLSASPSPS